MQPDVLAPGCTSVNAYRSDPVWNRFTIVGY